ncbi:MAG: hypothetical protein KDD44_12455, partial [Bdellovibrionales bacterium]|nr:hypothetical protein [Bdellovibrionales bacterium]
LELNGQLLHRTTCQFPRRDVYRLHPASRRNLNAGFVFEFPLDALRVLEPDALALVAVCGRRREVLWKWAGAEEAEGRYDTLGAERALRDYFNELPSPPLRESSSSDLELLIRTQGQGNFLENCLTELSSSLASAGDITLRRISFVMSGSAHEELIRSKLVGLALLANVEVRFFSDNDSLAASTEKQLFFSEDQLVFGVDDQYSLAFLDTVALLRSFQFHKEVTLLMPALYGSENGLRLSTDRNLYDLRSEVSPSAVLEPWLCATRSVGPVWVTSGAFLNQVSSGIYGDTPSVATSCPVSPPSERVLYHLDLRQPLVAVTTVPSPLMPGQREYFQSVLDGFELSGEVHSAPVVGVVLPSNLKTRDLLWGSGYTLRCFIRQLQRQGFRPLLIQDGASESALQIEGYFVERFEMLSDRVTTGSLAYLVATPWDSVRPAVALRYLAGCPVVRIFVEREVPQFERSGRETFNT